MNDLPPVCPPMLQDLARSGVLRDLDVQLVAAMVRTHGVSGPVDNAGWLLLALASRVVGDGHICLDLDELDQAWCDVTRGRSDDGAAESAPALPIPDACRELAGPDRRGAFQTVWSAVVGLPGENRPFILDGHRLYLRRMYDYERRVATRLHELALDAGVTLAPEIASGVNELLQDEAQRQAARLALTRRLAIVTGGPGTGKTYLAARVLALLSHLPSTDGIPLRVRLAAPTGKAAARMGEALRLAREEIRDAFRDGIVIEPACTLERLLGFRFDSPYYRHDARHPLEADVVLVDEASMIDLAKMAKLLDAIGAGTRLVLLGDMHQLASVEPGSVLAEICESQTLAPCVARLVTSRRFPPDSPIGHLSRGVNAARNSDEAGQAWAAIDAVSPTSVACRIRTVPVPEQLVDRHGRPDTKFATSVLTGFRDFLASDTPEAAFSALGGFRILCALRRGPFGAERVNALVRDILSLRHVPKSLTAAMKPFRHLSPSGEFYSHRVVMVTRNDYDTGLFNGDVGVVLPATAGGPLVTWFPCETAAGNDTCGAFRHVPCHLLPQHETAFAMTIHKSQGSEFGRILVLLPRTESPVLTKELIYTAITRPREELTLWSDRETFVEAACRRVRRFTGLRTQIDERTSV